MPRGEVNAKRRWWVPRFSLRTLTIVVMLVCAYVGAWTSTTKRGICDVVRSDLAPFRDSYLRDWGLRDDPNLEQDYIKAARRNGYLSTPMPFIVLHPAVEYERGKQSGITWRRRRQHYSIWVYGLI